MENLITTFHPTHFLQESGPHSTHYYSRRCVICEKWMSPKSNYFYCRSCDFYFHKECTTSLMENLTIDRPETHAHTLTFIRKRNPFNCDACGRVSKDVMNMYGCLSCNFFIHRDCMYLPKVIKLTRHSHRLFHTYKVPDCNTKCRRCENTFVPGCGGYICIDKTCDYKLHSYCATDKNTWDGRDVEGEPEETKCDFALHDTCASLPRKMEHTFHRHPITLEVDIEEGFFRCSKCERESCGFMYRCCQEECDFKMDAKCASLSDPLYSRTHEHPLSLADYGASCYKCSFYLGPNRVSLPVLVKCNYDTHPLTICLFESIKSWVWPPFHCEICEIRIKPKYPDYEYIYGCFDCNTVVHVECAIGKYPFLKPGHTIKLNGFEIEIEIASNSLSRPICHACHSTCQDKLVFKNKSSAISFCSINCITTSS
ncbi:hypothetical protein BRARA_E02756 [Brassica rapa]|uniref:Zinc finger PHD-type domain-containing protein n=1 Tax=Brassica campestris TaxID=3711 RepID=A0A397ZDR6_BRACM|nr:hypothetical protein BRARA_E02756 [Brassica rapa]